MKRTRSRLRVSPQINSLNRSLESSIVDRNHDRSSFVGPFSWWVTADKHVNGLPLLKNGVKVIENNIFMRSVFTAISQVNFLDFSGQKLTLWVGSSRQTTQNVDFHKLLLQIQDTPSQHQELRDPLLCQLVSHMLGHKGNQTKRPRLICGDKNREQKSEDNWCCHPLPVQEARKKLKGWTHGFYSVV